MDAICFGSIIVDHRRPMDASAPADLSAVASAEAEPIRIVDRAVNLHVGGIGILASALKRLGLEVGLMGLVGRDIAGCGLTSYLAGEIGLNVEAVRAIDAPTSSSFIRLTAEQRYVEHTPGASAELDPGEAELAFIDAHKPKLMAIGYCGLLPALDADGGAKMADWIAAVRSRGVIVALDTHSVPPYAMLAGPVPAADIFICNREESLGITGMGGQVPHDVLAVIWHKFPADDPARPRLLGVAMPEGVQLAYGAGADFAETWVVNPHYGTFEPTDLTGAGDCFRAGVYAEVLAQGSACARATADRSAFAAGRLDLAAVGLAGHDAACEFLKSR